MSYVCSLLYSSTFYRFPDLFHSAKRSGFILPIIRSLDTTHKLVQ